MQKAHVPRSSCSRPRKKTSGIRRGVFSEFNSPLDIVFFEHILVTYVATLKTLKQLIFRINTYYIC